MTSPTCRIVTCLNCLNSWGVSAKVKCPRCNSEDHVAGRIDAPRIIKGLLDWMGRNGVYDPSDVPLILTDPAAVLELQEVISLAEIKS